MAGLSYARTLCELFQHTSAELGDRPALRTTDATTSLTWAQYRDAVRETAARLAGLGVEPGDTVALMMGNRPEFHVVDTAALHLGATPFSIYTTFAPATIAHLLGNARPKVVVVARELLGAVQKAAVDADVVTLDELAVLAPAADFDFEAAWRAVAPDALATIIYTSGTTGPPKGVELTHANVLADVRASSAVLPFEPGDVVPSAFPMAHAAERWATHYQGMAHGLDVTCVADLAELPAVLKTTRPTIWGSVPRVWEKLYAGLQAAIAANPGLADQPEMLRAAVGLDRVRWAVVGSAPTPPHVLEFFAGIGITLCELWGMSELTCVATVNPPGAPKLGTVGKPIPGVELRLASDGEIEVRGDVVMRAYRDDPEKTAETFTEDGWLKTGDIGAIDDDGYVSIVDRKKELLITASGKNLSPTNIESTVKGATPLLAHAVAIGDGKPYITALLVLDPERGAEVGDPLVHEQLGEAVERANAGLARIEQVKRWVVVDDVWVPGGQELTPTMKLKRRAIHERYANEISGLYT
ncbi:MAG: long-chain fatty acid--CoA ligase [Solirubrobacteraceae bacterium]|nr:long-chain fatty acid--CoA ligase [Solirubrobacteraceae bacterium]